jgi:hypothetical protein
MACGMCGRNTPHILDLNSRFREWLALSVLQGKSPLHSLNRRIVGTQIVLEKKINKDV